MLDFGFYNMDCMEGMKEFPDKYFDLAIVDPPYGDGGGYMEERNEIRRTIPQVHESTSSTMPESGQVNHGGRWGGWSIKNGRNMGSEIRKKIVAWDVAPGKEYFEELFRISRNQIIWGGNYFDLPPTRCFLIWRKINVPEKFSMAMAEYAWTSFKGNAKVFDYSAVGQEGRFHPTQKPPELYKWILTNYAKQGDKILDTHVGSASSLIACYDLGFDYVGFEIDEEYYKLATKRIEEEKAQVRWTW